MKKWVQDSPKANVIHKFGHHARNMWKDLTSIHHNSEGTENTEMILKTRDLIVSQDM